MKFQTWNWYRENYTIKSTIDAVKFSNTMQLSPKQHLPPPPPTKELLSFMNINKKS